MFVLTFLGYLNLSCNNFNGKIPTGRQLQSFNASSYIRNPKLCGAFLNNCSMKVENPKSATPSTENEDDVSIKEIIVHEHRSGICSRFLGDLWFFVSY